MSGSLCNDLSCDAANQSQPLITLQGCAEIRPLGNVWYSDTEKRAGWDIDGGIVERSEVESCAADDTLRRWVQRLDVTKDSKVSTALGQVDWKTSGMQVASPDISSWSPISVSTVLMVGKVRTCEIFDVKIDVTNRLKAAFNFIKGSNGLVTKKVTTCNPATAGKLRARVNE